MGKYIDLSGRRFGKIKVLFRSGTSINKKPIFKVVCDCGVSKDVVGSGLLIGHIVSCGCSKGFKHGLSKTKEYRVWAGMLSRCRDKNLKIYPLYGGRGIKVCDRWLEFSNFMLDMGERPSDKHSIDRVDVNGNYEPNNCRWADRETQDNNKRSNVYLTMNGVTKTMKQWCILLGVKQPTMRCYLKRHSFNEAYNRYNGK